MPDGRRLTPERVAGFALEAALACVVAYGLYDLKPSMWSSVEVKSVAPKRPDATRRTQRFLVGATHQQMVLDAVNDFLPRLQELGYAIVNAIVPQAGHPACHDLVLELRKVGQRCLGQFSCEVKVRTFPSNRLAMRSDCAGLFLAATRKSQRWLGQLVVVAEMTAAGCYMQSKAELILRDRPRAEALSLWGYPGARVSAPPSGRPQGRVAPKAVPKATVAAPTTAPQRPTLPSWNVAWGAVTKYSASFTDEEVAKLKDFVVACGPLMRRRVPHASRIVAENKDAPLRWVEDVHWGRGVTRGQGRSRQGGGAPPIVVRKSSLEAYHKHLVRFGV